MKITRKRLRQLIQEIARRSSLSDSGNYNADSFVKWADSKMKSASKSSLLGQGFEIVEQSESDGIRIVSYFNGEPCGYMFLSHILAGYKVATVSVSELFRQGGSKDPQFGIASKMYEHAIQNYQIYSGDSQTTEARRMYVRLFKKYPGCMEGVNVNTGEIFPLKIADDGSELELDVPGMTAWTGPEVDNGIYFRFKK